MADANEPGDWRLERERVPPALSPEKERTRQEALDAIAALRDAIDQIDIEIVTLLNRRASQALEIGRLKRTLAMEIYQPSREEAVLRHVRSINPGPLDADAVARLFERIIDEARRLERVTDDGEHGP